MFCQLQGQRGAPLGSGSPGSTFSFLNFPLGPFFSLVGFFLLFTSLWYLSVLYLVWLFLDWDTSQQGEC